MKTQAKYDRIAAWSLAAIILGNGVDIVATIILLETNIAREINPVIALLYQASPLLFSVVKSIVLPLAAYHLYRDPDPGARRTLAAGALLYVALSGYYLIIFPLLVFLRI